MKHKESKENLGKGFVNEKSGKRKEASGAACSMP
jgi:hypothetical protein